MGGGTSLLEANRLGFDVTGFDINPMSYWIVKQEIEHLNLTAYDEAANFLRDELEKDIGILYLTQCAICGSEEAHVKYFLWVKTIGCEYCEKRIDLFPGYLLSSDARHPKNVFVCSSCGKLTETNDRKSPGTCRYCGAFLSLKEPASRNSCSCPRCGKRNHFPNARLGPPRHRLFAMEYHCPSCKSGHTGRFFKSLGDQDLRRVVESEARWAKLQSRFVPDDVIPSGDETNRLHRWGYTRYREMFNARQLLGLERSARIISAITNERVRNALATNLSDLLRYQNMLCRYDTIALKSLDIFSVHGFPVGLIQCESNFLGIVDRDRNVCVGSGGWKNITEKFHRAKSFCDAPFEVRHIGKRKVIVPIKGEWIGDHSESGKTARQRIVQIHCGDAGAAELPESSLDAVFTDPPYYGNVQYAELMDFCYVWLRRLIGNSLDIFKNYSTRNPLELTGNMDIGRGLQHFIKGFSSVFQRMVKALKPGAPLAFTYHHNTIEAFVPVAVAILDSGLTCSASLPCPAETGASIHINGTGSSIIDTVFVCRTTGVVSRKTLASSPGEEASLVRDDLGELRRGNVKPSPGDTRCIAYGHLVRLAIWNLRRSWDKTAETSPKTAAVLDWFHDFGGWPEVERGLNEPISSHSSEVLYEMPETVEEYGVEYGEISF